ncbi:MAG: DUF166 domain-containing protein [Candidatus Ranarchaeia archaeon]
MLDLVFIYSDDFGERVIRNMINDPSFCKTCGLLCDYCKYGVYSHVTRIRSAVKLEDPKNLPSFIEDPEKYLPRHLPKADICILSGVHQDLMLALPDKLNSVGISALITPVEDFQILSSGLCKQLENTCEEYSIEYAAPKPFCALEPDNSKPLITRFIKEFNVGKPLVDVSIKKRGHEKIISGVTVKRSAPCGSTWYVARRIMHKPVEKDSLRDTISKSHHSFPCTATMNKDPELGDAILHIAGYLIRDAIEKQLFT